MAGVSTGGVAVGMAAAAVEPVRAVLAEGGVAGGLLAFVLGAMMRRVGCLQENIKGVRQNL